MKILIISLASFLGLMYTCYWAGRVLERRAYTKYFVEATEVTYYDGYNDGQQIGRKQGYELGKTDGYNKCLNEE